MNQSHMSSLKVVVRQTFVSAKSCVQVKRVEYLTCSKVHFLKKTMQYSDEEKQVKGTAIQKTV